MAPVLVPQERFGQAELQLFSMGMDEKSLHLCAPVWQSQVHHSLECQRNAVPICTDQPLQTPEDYDLSGDDKSLPTHTLVRLVCPAECQILETQLQDVARSRRESCMWR